MTDLIATGAIGLSPLDWGALILYLLVVMAVGLSYAKGERDTESYLLGGRSIAWWAVGISFTVSLTSTLSFVGTPGEAYEHGLTLSMSMLVMPIAAISSFYLFVRFHFKQRMFTPFELPGAALRPSRTRHRSRPFLADSSQLFGAGALFVVEGLRRRRGLEHSRDNRIGWSGGNRLYHPRRHPCGGVDGSDPSFSPW